MSTFCKTCGLRMDLHKPECSPAAIAMYNQPDLSQFSVSLEDVVDAVQDQLCDWGTDEKLRDGQGLRDRMNGIAKAILRELYKKAGVPE